MEDSQKERIKLQFKTDEWLTDEADRLIKAYKKCKSIRARNKLIAKMEYVKTKMQFELRELDKLINE